MVEYLRAARDFIGTFLVMVGFKVMTDACAVHVSLAIAETVRGAEATRRPAIRRIPPNTWR